MLVVGVGAGAFGARAILTYRSSPHRPPVALRTIRRQRGQTVASTISDGLTAVLAIATTRGLEVDRSAIAYRVDEDADAIGRSQRPTWLVQETAAQLRYLRYTGTVPTHGSAVLCDVGSTGMTVSVVDLAAGETVGSRRAATFCGDDLDRIVRRHLAANDVRVDLDVSRSIKERLSSTGVVSAHDYGGGRHHVITRGDFVDLIAGPVRYAAMVIEQTVALAGVDPATIVLLGGSANVASIGAAFERRLGLRTVVPPHPEQVSARGAALLSPDTARAALFDRGGYRLTNFG